MSSSPPRAACLTAPGLGGIAVIQVAGEAAAELVGPHLRRGGLPVDLSRWQPDELRLCRVMDGPEVIDDAIVSVRSTDAGETVVDLNVHGGPRIVQRVLLMLQRHGARIVEPRELLTICWPAPTRVHADAMELVLTAKTRRTAMWFAGLAELLVERLERVVDFIRDARLEPARRMLEELLAGVERTQWLIRGVRVVLIGKPNSGKSTLANALAEQEHAITSDLPGTTRDWTEHPTAIEGVPFTIVDTAGIRQTDDPIEVEAIRRAREQVSKADLLIRVNDLTEPPDNGKVDPPLVSAPLEIEHPAVLDVYNKADLCADSDAGQAGGLAGRLRISALQGPGIERLRTTLLEQIGLGPGSAWPIAPFTTEQIASCRQAHQALAGASGLTADACERLPKLLERPGVDRTA